MQSKSSFISKPAASAAPPQTPPRTDWGNVAKWYDDLVGDEGSEYHRQVIFPGLMRLLAIGQGDKVLDVACGQGALCRQLQSKRAIVTGIDAARPLIEAAKRRSENPQPGETHARHETPINYIVGDVRDLNQRRELHGKFDAAACVLAIQNITPVRPVFEGVAACLRSGLTTPFGGRFVLVLNHPAFRSPQFTSWGWDAQEMVQYRRVERYLLPRKHTIITHPGKDPRTHTLSFHQPISTYVKALRQAGLFVEAIEEWASHKTSDSGPRARAENEARDEIPLFMAIRAVKISGAAAGANETPAPDDAAV